MADNTATNPITGDRIATKRSTTYADNYDAIFRKDISNQLLHDPVDGFNHTSPRKEEEKCKKNSQKLERQ
jgi:hypothetical protein